MSEDINVGAISEALNNKVDLNQLNTNAQGLSYGSGWGMPSSKYIDLELGASGTIYTAPANGYCVLAKSGSQGEYAELFSVLSGVQDSSTIGSTGNWARVSIPCRKGDSFCTYYTATGDIQLLRFYHAEGDQ